jgi:predicted regulator of Ras-like GTPase activity (Roadblock/LC7/MglB family)
MEEIEEVLADLLGSVPGATMAGLLGMDGLAVQIALAESFQEVETELLEVELAALAEAVQKAAGALAAAPSPEFFLGTPRCNFLGAPLNAGVGTGEMPALTSYFLVLGLSPDADLGKAREALKRACASLSG